MRAVGPLPCATVRRGLRDRDHDLVNRVTTWTKRLDHRSPMRRGEPVERLPIEDVRFQFHGRFAPHLRGRGARPGVARHRPLPACTTARTYTPGWPCGAMFASDVRHSDRSAGIGRCPRMRSTESEGAHMTAEKWALEASAFFSGLAAGFLGGLCTIIRPMQAAMDGRDFRNFMETFLRY